MKGRLMIMIGMLVVAAWLPVEMVCAERMGETIPSKGPVMTVASVAACPCQSFSDMSRMTDLPEGQLRCVDRLWSQHSPLFPGETSLYVLHPVSYETLWMAQVTWHPGTGERGCYFMDAASGEAEQRLLIAEEELDACRALILESGGWSLCP